mmetsp:Transcript_9270/g.20217  ORF Transcript_9270/g.20217 Transcript_9270/m.20217 type:complete len:87 (-) Transcript_9270:194-454(-)
MVLTIASLSAFAAGVPNLAWAALTRTRPSSTSAWVSLALRLSIVLRAETRHEAKHRMADSASNKNGSKIWCGSCGSKLAKLELGQL